MNNKIGIFALSVLATGCAHTFLSKVAGDNTHSLSGVAYSLPKGQIQLTASRISSKGDQAKALASSADANKAFTDAQDALTKANASKDKTKINSAKTDLSNAKQSLEAAKAALDVANSGQWVETATLTVLPSVPDPKAKFIGDINHWYTRDDNIKLSLVNGLLNTTTIGSTDQIPNIIVTLADIALSVMTLGAGGPSLPVIPNRAGEAPQTSKDCNYSVSEIFNPLDINDYKRVNSQLYKMNAGFRISIPQIHNVAVDSSTGSDEQTTTETTVAEKTSGDKNAQANPNGNKIEGIKYRLATSIMIKDVILPKDEECRKQTIQPAAQSITAIVPDSNSEYMISSEAGPFTATNRTIGFTNGLLTDYSVNEPSEVLALLQIPLTIANHIIQIPTQIIQAKVNYNSQAAALVNAQTTLQQAQIQQGTTLDNAKAALLNAQAALNQADIQNTTNVVNARTALVNAITVLNQAEIGQPTAIANANLALLNAQQAFQKALNDVAKSNTK